MTVLARAAARAPVPVFAAVGSAARDEVQDLRLRPEVRLVGTPRHAAVLLVAGDLPSGLKDAVARVHDQVPTPRVTVWLGAQASRGVAGADLPAAAIVSPGGDLVEAIRQVHREMILRERASEPTILPHEPPAPWQGVGPHGQGGEGMMGGKPYGRAMPMTGPDRDGLALDRLALRIGPFLPAFPPGLALDVVLQGDVVQEVQPPVNPFALGGGGAQDRSGSVFADALQRPVAVADLEVARARHHLRWLADALAFHGLGALAARVLRLATHADPDMLLAVRRLCRTLLRNRTLRWATQGVGVVDPRRLENAPSGPAARAAGVAVDVRTDDPAYREIGFAPVTQTGGDAWARLRQRVAEAEQSLELAALADERGSRSAGGGRVESPHGEVTSSGCSADRLLQLLPDLLPGMEWGDAVATIVSLDLDLEEAARHATARTGI